MSHLDRNALAEKIAAVERHLARVEALLPARAADLRPATEMSDGVILHLWQAVQIAIDVAVALCVRLGLGAPTSYAAAFEKLEQEGYLGKELVSGLIAATGFRNRMAHAYETVDLVRVHAAAQHGPATLRLFLKTVAKLVT